MFLEGNLSKMLSYAELEKSIFDATQTRVSLENSVVLSENKLARKSESHNINKRTESLMHQIREANRNRFGSRSERDADPRQMSLFELFPNGICPRLSQWKETITVP